jgi:hypothetical protein
MDIVRLTHRARGQPKGASIRLLGAAATFVATTLWGGGGCSSAPEFEFDDLNLVPVQEELSEFSLGKYWIPIPLVDNRDSNRPPRRNKLQVEFELFALFSPHDEWQITEGWKRHEGKIRDRVIRICRNASLDELQEPELETLKDQLMDALAPHLGEKELRRLVITEIVSQELGVQSDEVAKSESAHGEHGGDHKAHGGHGGNHEGHKEHKGH